MVVLGLILVLVAVVAGVVLVYENSDSVVTINAFGGQWRADAYWLAVIGAVILVVAVLGIVMIRAGSRRGLRRRQERKQLERENAALAAEVRHPAPSARTGDTRHDDARHDDTRHGDARYDAPRTDAPPSYDPSRSPGAFDKPPPNGR